MLSGLAGRMRLVDGMASTSLSVGCEPSGRYEWRFVPMGDVAVTLAVVRSWSVCPMAERRRVQYV